MPDIINELLDVGEAHARKILLELRQKELVPLYHLVSGGDEKDVLISCSFTNKIEKQISFLTAKNTAKRINAIAGMFIGESWMVALSEDKVQTIDLQPQPSEHPERIEVVMLVATTGKETRSRTLRMIRDKKNRVIDLLADPDPVASLATGVISGGMIDGLITQH